MSLELVNSYTQPGQVASFDQSSAEILAHYPRNNCLFVINGYTQSVDVLKARDLSFILAIPVGRPIQSLAIYNDALAVVAAHPTNKQLPGTVIFYDLVHGYAKTNELEVGSLPDAVFFSPDGKKLIVCNEGEPDDVWDAVNTDVDHNPEGTVSIVYIEDIDATDDIEQSDVVHVDFNNFDVATLQASGVKITGPGSDNIGPAGTTLSQYLEPEYAAISKNSDRAYVCLQENNALAVIDLETHSATAILPFGMKDMSVPYNAFDASDKSAAVDIKPWPNVLGMRQPDGVALMERHGRCFVLTANEGDAQDYGSYSEEGRVKDLPLDPIAFPNAAITQLDTELGRLKITTELGTNAAGNYDTLYAYGGRSFSVYELRAHDTQLQLMFDSGAQFEQITAVSLPSGFNASNDQNGFKKRSDDKGPEPENVVVRKVGRHYFAIVALERVGGLMLYDVTDPSECKFVQYLNNRNFAVTLSGPPTELELDVVRDLGPEGMVLFDRYLAVANEVSGTTTLYEVDKPRPIGVSRNFSLAAAAVLSVTLSLAGCLCDAPGATIQWVKDNNGLLSILAGETAPTFSIAVVDPGDDAEYFALVTTSSDSLVDCRATERVGVQP